MFFLYFFLIFFSHISRKIWYRVGVCCRLSVRLNHWWPVEGTSEAALSMINHFRQDVLLCNYSNFCDSKLRSIMELSSRSASVWAVAINTAPSFYGPPNHRLSNIPFHSLAKSGSKKFQPNLKLGLELYRFIESHCGLRKFKSKTSVLQNVTWNLWQERASQRFRSS